MGLFGKEEKTHIEPAVRVFRSSYVRGPVPADAVFYDAFHGRYDAVICHYHDQAMIPLKMIARDTGVNITAGLPFIRTSPDHGTAFDRAGLGTSDQGSLAEATRLAAALAGGGNR